MSYARRHSTNVCPGNRVRYKHCNEDDPALAVDVMDINEDGQIQEFTVFMRPQ